MGRRRHNSGVRYLSPSEWSDAMLRDVLNDYPDNPKPNVPNVKTLTIDESREMARKALAASDAAYYESRRNAALFKKSV